MAESYTSKLNGEERIRVVNSWTQDDPKLKTRVIVATVGILFCRMNDPLTTSDYRWLSEWVLVSDMQDLYEINTIILGHVLLDRQSRW